MSALLANRTQREKLLMAALAALALVWLAMTYVWQPLQAHRRALTASIPRIERAMAQLAANPVAPSTQAADPRDVGVLISETASSFGLNITRLEPQGATIRVTLAEAPFDTVLLWLEALQRDNALRLLDLTLTRRTAPGMVATTLTAEI